MKRCTVFCAGKLRAPGPSAYSRRWKSYDQSQLTREALLDQVESGLGHDAAGKPLRVDPDTKNVTTAVGDLPISPLMDPAWMKARRREKKPEGSRPTGRFRKKLSNNPFATALISPVRRCPITGVSLPRELMQDFELLRNPNAEANDKQAWWVPSATFWAGELIPNREHWASRPKEEDGKGKEGCQYPSPSAIDGPQDTKTTATLPSLKGATESDAAGRRDVTDASAAPAFAPSPNTHTTTPDTNADAQLDHRPQRAPLVSYVLARKAVLDTLSQGPGGKPNRKFLYKMLSLRNGMAATTGSIETVWRHDMGDFVLKMMRRQATNALIDRATHSQSPTFKFIQPSADWDAAGRVAARGCVLWLPKDPSANPGTARASAAGAGPGAAASASAGLYATLDVEGAKFGNKVVVHNLPCLLGSEEVERLRAESAMFRDNEILVLKHWKSMPMHRLHRLLWRLHGYLAEPGVVAPGAGANAEATIRTTT